MSPALFACITLVLAKHATSLGFKRGSITSNVCCLQRCWFAHIVYHAKQASVDKKHCCFFYKTSRRVKRVQD